MIFFDGRSKKSYGMGQVCCPILLVAQKARIGFQFPCLNPCITHQLELIL